MGNGSGTGGLNSRVYTNSYAGKSIAMAFPFKNGGSFGGLSKPQYSYVTYNSLAYHGSGAGGRADKWASANGLNISFVPPSSV
jgi:hypothetical protein